MHYCIYYTTSSMEEILGHWILGKILGLAALKINKDKLSAWRRVDFHYRFTGNSFSVHTASSTSGDTLQQEKIVL